MAVTNGGTGYAPSSTIVASGGGSPAQQAVLALIIASGVIESVAITSGGIYGTNSAPTLTVNSLPITATATVSVMPFGTQGTNVETYQGRVWVFNGPLGQFTAPGSATDFSTADGGGSFTSSDSFLKVAYIQAVQTNGFLFLIADSSMNYISGVATSGSPPTTT